jgi:HK97 family phage major capsid protein
MSDRKTLVSERSKLVAQASDLNKIAEVREWTPEETAKVDDLIAKIEALDARVVELENYESEPAEAEVAPEEAPVDPEQNSRRRSLISGFENKPQRRTAPAPIGVPMFSRDLDDKRSEKDRTLAMRGWFAGKNASKEERSAAFRTGLDVNSDRLVLRANSTSGTAGGYTIPQGFLAQLEQRAAYFNPLRDVATVVRTDTSNNLPFPVIDDTANVSAIGAENTAPSAVDMVFSQITLGSYRTESLIKLSNELLRDSGLDMPSIIANLLGERIGRKEATDHATGNGSSAPEGVVTGSSAGVAGATTTTITLANVMGLRNSLDYAYQQNASFMMHQSVWNSILQLADSQARPLFLDLLNGNQAKLLGYPVIVNNAMASSIAASAKTVLFGDFSKYIIRDCGDIVIVRLNELYAAEFATGFLAARWSDAKVSQTNAIKRITQPAS